MAKAVPVMAKAVPVMVKAVPVMKPLVKTSHQRITETENGLQKLGEA